MRQRLTSNAERVRALLHRTRSGAPLTAGEGDAIGRALTESTNHDVAMGTAQFLIDLCDDARKVLQVEHAALTGALHRENGGEFQ